MGFNLFGKPAAPPKESVVSLVGQLRTKGLDNGQIVQSLQKDGYSAAEIYDALQLEDQHKQVQAAQQQPAPPKEQPMADGPPAYNYQPQSVIPDQNYGMSGMPPQPPPPAGYSNPFPSGPGLAPPGSMPPMSSDSDTAQIEQLIEAVIEEKWKDIERNITKIIEWKDRTESSMNAIVQEIDMLKGQFDTLQKALVGKIGDYDKNIVEVGAQLNAMEKAFSKVLPTFTENINELGRITQRLKK
ncbi:MAG TPA: hypothetical protein VK158_05520 [Acidobacteriota bacterium]|nr:hypothetical protein [Acidobacteriota bacterium]